MPSEQGFLDLNEDVNQRMIGVSLQVLIQQVWVGVGDHAFVTGTLVRLGLGLGPLV